MDASTTTTASDPAFAVIEAHRIANADLNAIGDEFLQVAPKSPHGRSGPELPKDLVDRMTDADEAERRAIRALVASRPATMEGATALIDYLGTLLRDRDRRVWS
jgi:hypothetical protein